MEGVDRLLRAHAPYLLEYHEEGTGLDAASGRAGRRADEHQHAQDE